jgi:two-component system response regulator QseB
MRVLIVEDDALLGDGMANGLRTLGFTVDWCRNGDDAEALLRSAEYDAIVLDLGLPGADGMSWLSRWRARSEFTPVLILTARDAIDSRIRGLDAGGDDYLIKPIALQELAARLRAVARRARGRPEPVWQHGALEFDASGRTVRWRGTPVPLTSRETALLELLLVNRGRILSKAQIVDKLYGFGEEIDSNALEVFVHHLRRKIDPGIVRTVRGMGYALGEPEGEGAS